MSVLQEFLWNPILGALVGVPVTLGFVKFKSIYFDHRDSRKLFSLFKGSTKFVVPFTESADKRGLVSSYGNLLALSAFTNKMTRHFPNEHRIDIASDDLNLDQCSGENIVLLGGGGSNKITLKMLNQLAPIIHDGHRI